MAATCTWPLYRKFTASSGLLEELTHPVFVSHTPWGCLLARAGSVHLPHVAQRARLKKWFWEPRLCPAGLEGRFQAAARGLGHTDTPRAALCSAPPLPVWSRPPPMVCSMMWWVVRKKPALLPTWEGWGMKGLRGLGPPDAFRGCCLGWWPVRSFHFRGHNLIGVYN